MACLFSCFRKTPSSPPVEFITLSSPNEDSLFLNETLPNELSSNTTSEQVTDMRKQKICTKKIYRIACIIFKSACGAAIAGTIAGTVIGSPIPGIGNVVFGVLGGIVFFIGGLIYCSLRCKSVRKLY